MLPSTLRISWAAAVGLLVGSFLCLATLGVLGQDATADEGRYFGLGRTLLETGSWVGRRALLLHPPLSYYISSLPLLGWNGPLSAREPFPLLLSRLTSLLVFAVPLLLLTAWWARRLFGREAALVALALAAFSPTLLAHAPLITPDVPVAATGLLAIVLFCAAGSSLGRSCAWGAALGLALLSKSSGWLFAGVIMAVSLVEALRGGGWRVLRAAGCGLMVALLVVNLGYGFEGVADWRGKAELVAKVPPQPLPRAMAWAAAPLFPLPYLHSVGIQLAVGRRGWPAFLMGELSQTGWWHYYLFALAIKETLPFLLLLAGGLAAWRLRGLSGRDALCLALVPVAFFAFFGLGRVQIGIRYVLPAFPFLFVIASRAVLPPQPRWRRPLGMAVAALLGWHALSAVRASPHYLAYFNELVGGPRQGYLYLGDSNLDWGQNRSRMEDLAWRRGIALEPPVVPQQGRVAVAAYRLQGIVDRQTYRILREEHEPVDHVGYNWLIYDLDRGPRLGPTLSLPGGPQWRASSTPEAARWREPETVVDWPAAEPAIDTGLEAQRAYPGTDAVLMRCPQPGPQCLYRRSFTLAARPPRAVLRLAVRDAYELWANGATVARREACAAEFVQDEHRLEEHLRAGPNAVVLRTRACGPGPASAAFIELRVNGAGRAP